jgi:hypothetical protein
MQQEVEIQIKGVKAQMKGQSDAILRFLKEMEKKTRGKRRRRRRKRQSLKQELIRWMQTAAAVIVI